MEGEDDGEDGDEDKNEVEDKGKKVGGEGIVNERIRQPENRGQPSSRADRQLTRRRPSVFTSNPNRAS